MLAVPLLLLFSCLLLMAEAQQQDALVTFEAHGFQQVRVCSRGSVHVEEGSIIDFGPSSQQLALRHDVFLQARGGCKFVDTYCLQVNRAVPHGNHGVDSQQNTSFPLENFKDQFDLWSHNQWSHDREEDFRSRQLETFRQDAQGALTEGAVRALLAHMHNRLGLATLFQLLPFILLAALVIALVGGVVYLLFHSVFKVAAEPYISAAAGLARQAESVRLRVQAAQAVQARVIDAVETTLVRPAVLIADAAIQSAQSQWVVFGALLLCAVTLVAASCTPRLEKRVTLGSALVIATAALEHTFLPASRKLAIAATVVAAALLVTSAGSLCVGLVHQLCKRVPANVYLSAAVLCGTVAIGCAVALSPSALGGAAAVAIFSIGFGLAFLAPLLLGLAIGLASVCLDALVLVVLPAACLAVAMSRQLSPFVHALPDATLKSWMLSMGLGANYWDLLLHNPASLLNPYELERHGAGLAWPLLLLLLCCLPRVAVYWMYDSKVSLARFVRCYLHDAVWVLARQLAMPIIIAVLVAVLGGVAGGGVVQEYAWSALHGATAAALGLLPVHFAWWSLTEVVVLGGERLAVQGGETPVVAAAADGADSAAAGDGQAESEGGQSRWAEGGGRGRSRSSGPKNGRGGGGLTQRRSTSRRKGR